MFENFYENNLETGIYLEYDHNGVIQNKYQKLNSFIIFDYSTENTKSKSLYNSQMVGECIEYKKYYPSGFI